MISKITNILVYVLLVGVILYQWNPLQVFGEREKEVITVRDSTHTRDTVTIRDTEYISVPPPKPEIVQERDTFIIVEKDTVFLPFQQKFYKTPEYHAWVSGINPSLDSIRVFPITRTIYDTKTIMQTRYIRDYRMYIQGGFSYLSGNISPNIGILLTTPSDFAIQANFGIYRERLFSQIMLSYQIKTF